jgi:hypothetical protein
MGTSMSEFMTVQMNRCAFTHLRASDLFLHIKCIAFLTLELLHQVGGFTVGKG